MFRATLIPGIFLLTVVGAPLLAQEQEPVVDKSVWDQVVVLYEQAKEKGETAAEDVYEWAREDVEKIGDWEYKVEYLANPNHIALEKKLNELGTERWEAVWIDRQGPNLIVTLKRPSRTWLNKLPLGQLIKAAAGAGDGGGGE
ncbi:MAG: hypothetical protein GTN89_11260 [Acidobacteria bacterium]|nr:hypothetical protein [Acidobacteriota bacterium]NIM62286.1 hypothetical protein [Acidobacteriota bacterium]NIO59840.1 hypothetical protein [Acidobacteriota bacterium]NIQ30925.1 hypothetical protein [Acidobacteriota bacterium]NIQ85999.1 hypothetical protein [Acidobacteriota bacterium]